MKDRCALIVHRELAHDLEVARTHSSAQYRLPDSTLYPETCARNFVKEGLARRGHARSVGELTSFRRGPLRRLKDASHVIFASPHPPRMPQRRNAEACAAQSKSNVGCVLWCWILLPIIFETKQHRFPDEILFCHSKYIVCSNPLRPLLGYPMLGKCQILHRSPFYSI